MKVELKDSEVLNVVIGGVEYFLQADGRLSNDKQTFNLDDIFKKGKKAKSVPKVDYSKVMLPDFISLHYIVSMFNDENVFTLQDFIDLNDKIIDESKGNNDIFTEWMMRDSRGNIISCRWNSDENIFNSYSIVSVISHVYMITGGDLPINVSGYRGDYKISNKNAHEVMSCCGLDKNILTKRYYKYYKEA